MASKKTVLPPAGVPLIAIVGRPNVGKSTLFNRLVGRKMAIVDDTPGVTRDRRYGEASLAGVRFDIIDTAGMDEGDETSLNRRMLNQTREAIAEADAVLFVIDARAGITPLDATYAQESRASGKKVILVANKAEGKAANDIMADLYSLGFTHVARISAEHGEGMADLFDELRDALGGAFVHHASDEDMAEHDEEAIVADIDLDEIISDDDAPVTYDARDDERIQIAVVGRPNAGKSTLINALIGEDRLLTGPEAGITRDAIRLPFFYHGREFRLVDTAGMRKRAKVHHKLEKLAVYDSIRSITYAHVVVVLLDAAAPLEKQDAQIASLVAREGRACVIAVNKWDEVKKGKKEFLEELRFMLNEQLAQVAGIPVVPISALKQTGLDDLMKAVLGAYRVWNIRVPTGALNRWLEGVVQHHSPPLVRGRRLKIKYMSQIKTRPPTFVLHCNMDQEFPESYLRYLVGGLRQTYAMIGTPIRLNLKASNNPFAKKKK